MGESVIYQDILQQGIQQGVQEGIQQGIQREKERLALNMLRFGMDIEQVANLTNLPIENVQNIQQILTQENSN